MCDNATLRGGLALNRSSDKSEMALVKEFGLWLSSGSNSLASSRAFFSPIPSSPHKFHIEFKLICNELRTRLLESVVRERHGDLAVRILRILAETGKMDEKHIAKMALTTNKEARPLLSTLSNESLIALQEVPRGNDRNPTRTFYLWYMDAPKTNSALLRNLYKAAFNVLARMQHESLSPLVRSARQKASRSDVIQDPSLLAESERGMLAVWEERRERLSIALSRLDCAIFVLRDLAQSPLESPIKM